jgi:adenine-specific DNA methylase
LSREERLEQEIAVLREQHEELQGMMQILMEQNKSITAQNKAFASLMGNMKEKYRKKLETLMLLFLFGKKPKQEEGEFLFPPQFENML